MSLAKHEQEIEKIRVQLNKIQEFEPYCAYRIIDTINKKEIHPNDLYYFFTQVKSQNLTLADIELYISIYDGEKKGYLDIHKEILYHQTEFKKLVKMLMKRDDFDMKSTINSLIRKGQFYSDDMPCYIDQSGLRYFFKRNGFYATSDDLNSLIKRFDLNYDDIISMEELARYFMLFEKSGDPQINRLSANEGYETHRVLNIPKSVQHSALKENYYSLGGDPSTKHSRESSKNLNKDIKNLKNTKKRTENPLQIQDLNSYRSALPSNRSSKDHLLPNQKTQSNKLSIIKANIPLSPNFQQQSLMSTRNHDMTLKKKYPNLNEFETETNAKTIVKFAKKTRMNEVLDNCQKIIHELDVNLEKFKCQLALKVDFNLRDFFKFFDTGNKGFIDHYDIEKICKYLSIKLKDGIEIDLIRNFIKTYDKDYDERLLFTDIGKAFLSKKQQYQELVVDRPSYYSNARNFEEVFSLETQKLIGQVLKMQFYIEKQNSEMQRKAENVDMLDEDFALAFQSINSIRD
ncbi:ef hand family protein [Stylonychia lemnae]|uniref:Ef hand family protein n=1 Tax=Stylonychia lemnae TaxID=5949 RepID=A0A078A9J5_STYLE|nr:ef hand family protein [Stylonychia lemnae]|eukprot:CDW78935.1 ef hand family protein [Stylonychia lemnae]